MLTGIPIPPGFDEGTLAGTGVTDRYGLGALVSGSIACAWLDLWVAADASGDDTAKDLATQAMGLRGRGRSCSR